MEFWCLIIMKTARKFAFFHCTISIKSRNRYTSGATEKSDMKIKHRKSLKVSFLQETCGFACLAVLVMLVSCGVPRSLFVDDDASSFTSSSEDVEEDATTYSTTGAFSIVFDESLVSIDTNAEENGIMLFYTITNGATIPTAQSIYTTNLVGSTSSLGSTRTFGLDVGEYYSNSAETENLYPFTFLEGSTATNFKTASGYAIPLNTGSSTNGTISCDFGLTATKNEDGYLEFTLTYDDGSEVRVLRNYNGNKFSSAATGFSSVSAATTAGYRDYCLYDSGWYLLDSPTIYIYAAFFFYAQQGTTDYTNHYWSQKLYSVGSFKLSSITEAQ